MSPDSPGFDLACAVCGVVGCYAHVHEAEVVDCSEDEVDEGVDALQPEVE
jgi:hypothetical protein